MTQFVPVAPRVSKPILGGRRALMLSCASVAIATAAVAPQKAHAQVAGTGSFTVGSGLINPSTGAVIINSGGQAVVDWSATGTVTNGVNEFLSPGNYLNFSSSADFAVLNRVSTGTDMLGLNGFVTSAVNGNQGQGRVYFYNPNGIVVGANAIFDVGSLLLSTLPLTLDPDNNNQFINNNQVVFGQALNPSSKIVTNTGAQINALSEGSYVAMVAPRVEQGGTVQVNGSAAYVAAEKVTMTISQGLFDIAVDVANGGGTSDANGVVHTGVTAGPASTGAGDNHRVYMVAVPKNQALEMLLGGNVGFDATNAGVVNGEIVLGAGVNILEADGSLAVGSPAGLNADLTINPGMYLSHVRGFARGDINAVADQGSLAFSGNLTLNSLNAAETGHIIAGAQVTNNFTVGGNLHLQTNNSVYTSNIDLRADGGTVLIGGNANIFGGGAVDDTIGIATIYAGSEGSLTINGETVVSVLAPAAGINPDVGSSDNYAGDISIVSSGDATITFGDNVALHASANGQNNSGNGDGSAGDGYGGDISMTSNGGWITVNGNLYANADGYGGDMLDGGLAGGAGHGGSISIAAYGGDITVNGNAFLTANGVGGSYVGEGVPSTALGGIGDAGSVNIFNGGPGVISLTGDHTLRADGIGGFGQTGGAGYGGNAGVYAYNGTIDLGTSVDISATGTGGNAAVGYGGDGGYGQGGTAYIEALAEPGDIEVPPSQSTITGGNATLDVSGYGGDGGEGDDAVEPIAAGVGGAGKGGAYGGEIGTGGAFAASRAEGASLTLGNTILISRGVGGAGGAGDTGQTGGAGGAGYGGSAQAGNYNPAAMANPTGTATYGNLTLDVGATGGSGGSGPAGQGSGGSAYGGGAGENSGGAFVNAKGTVTATSVTMVAKAIGGSGGNGGYGEGGYLQLASFADSVLNVTGTALLDASGVGGGGSVDGDGRGGWAGLYADGGGTATINRAMIRADGTGGTSASGDGGDGTGGTAEIIASGAGSAIAIQNETPSIPGHTRDLLSAQGFGGRNNGGGELVGGTGTGGRATVLAEDGGDIALPASAPALGVIRILARGTGGNAAADGGTGGTGQGGVVEIGVDGGTMSAFNVLPSSYGQGGNSANEGLNITGGAGFGGERHIFANNGGVLTISTGGGTTGGLGGNGSGTGDGGDGAEGTATLVVDGGEVELAGELLIWSGAQGGSGAIGGDATAGTATVTVLNGGVISGAGGTELNLDVAAFGGVGTIEGGAATGGTAILDAGAVDLSAGTVNVGASAQGGSAETGTGGAATGGSAAVNLANAAALSADTLNVDANATGGAGSAGGGGAIGGSASLILETGATAVFSVLSGPNLHADATGGAASAGTGGSADGGQTSVQLSETSSLTGQAIFATASGTGGSGTSGGYGSGGSVQLGVWGEASATLNGNNITNLSAEGTGGAGTIDGAGGDGFGGTVDVLIGGGSLSIGDGSFATDALFLARGIGGVGGLGGDGFGGDVQLSIGDAGGLLELEGTTNASAAGVGGNGVNSLDGTGGSGGDGVGGSVSLNTQSVLLPDATTALALGNLTLHAFGQGGQGASGAIGGVGGDGFGGDTLLYIGDVAATGGEIASRAQGIGGDGGVGSSGLGGDGGTGQGGSNTFVIDAAGSLDAIRYTGTTSTLGGWGGEGASGLGNGGGAQSGSNDVTIDGDATFTSTTDFTGFVVTSYAWGGDGASGGWGNAGSSSVVVNGSLTAQHVQSSAGAQGGNGTDYGGTASGGDASFEVNGTLDAVTMDVRTSALGGNGAFDGGNAYGGTTNFTVSGTADISGLAYVRANADGGDAVDGSGGYADAGTAEVLVSGELTVLELSVEAIGTGGDGLDGGYGIGGTAELHADGAAAQLELGNTNISATGRGGDGSDNGGYGSGGTATLSVTNGAVATLGYTDIVADGFGGHGTNATGGSGDAGFALLDVSGGALTASDEFWVSAEGEGGDGGTSGGDGYGGDAAVRVQNGSTAEFDVSLAVLAKGGGGASANGTGGDGIGGYARMSAWLGGDLTANDVTVNASGSGGDGVDGGDGIAQESVEGWGGAVLQSFDEGSSITLTGDTLVAANGTGGDGTTGAGGDGTGGYASLAAIGVPLTLQGGEIQANGTGGAGSGGAGTGLGGLATLRAHDGGSLVGGAIGVRADGSTDGGAVEIRSTTGASLETASLDASANGGASGGEVLLYVEWDANADLGTAALTATGGSDGNVTLDLGWGTSSAGFAGDVLVADDLTIVSSGAIDLLSQNGAGMNVVNTFDGTANGVITFQDITGGAWYSGDTMDLTAADFAFGWMFNVNNILLTLPGDYAVSNLPYANNSLSITAGGDITAAESIYYSTDLTLDAGGDMALVAVFTGGGLTLTAAGDMSTGDLDSGGGLTLNAGGNIAAGDLTAVLGVAAEAGGNLTVGDVLSGNDAPRGDFVAADVVASGENVTLIAAGNVVAGAITSGEEIDIEATSGSIATGNLTSALGIDLDAGMSIVFGNVDAGTELDFDAGGTINGGNIVAGTTVEGGAGGAVVLGDITTGDGAEDDDTFSVGIASETSITVGNVQGPRRIGFASLGDLTTGSLTGGSDVMLLVGGDVTTGAITSGEGDTVYIADASMCEAGGGCRSEDDDFDPDAVLALDPVATGGSITIGGPVTTGRLQAAAGTDLALGDVTAAQSIELSAGGLLTAGNLDAGTLITATSGADLEVGNATAVESITLDSGGGINAGALDAPVLSLTLAEDFASGDLTVADMLTIDAGGNLTTGNVTVGGDLSLTAGGALAALDLDAGGIITAAAGSDLSVNNVDAGTSATFSAGGLASFGGVVSAPTISVTSADIDVAGQLGVYGVTTLLTLNAVSDGAPILLGGAQGEGSGYQLSQDEDIGSSAVVFNAASAGEGPTPDVIFSDLAIDGSLSAGGGVSSAEVNTAGTVLVEGVVHWGEAALTDTLSINAGETIQVNTTKGGAIEMVGASSNPSGVLELTAHDVWVADQALLDQLNADRNFAGRDAALAANNGTVNPDGYITAGGMTVTMLGSSFFVQNSGTAEQPAGLTVGDGGLTIVNNGSEPADVTVFGQQSKSDGSTVTGDDFVEEVQFGGSGEFSDDSTVNGCEVGAGCTVVEPPPPTGENPPPTGGVEVILGPIGLMSSPGAIAQSQDPGGGDSGTGTGDGSGEEGTEEESEEEEEGEEESKGGVDASGGLINTGPVSIDTILDEPVTSGGDVPGGGQ